MKIAIFRLFQGSIFISLIGFLLLFAKQGVSSEKRLVSPVHFLPLGDSYTICQGLPANQSWPFLLCTKLSEKGKIVVLSGNPSRTGWTSQNLIDRELPIFDEARPDFVTVLIGVNDWVQGVQEETFKRNLRIILDHLQSRLQRKTHILLITIPDFSVVPAAVYFQSGRNISAGIASFNAIIRAEAIGRGLPLADIFPLTRRMKNDNSLVMPDGLHPSGKEYQLWLEIFLPIVEEMLH
jgi:lysophospholipase L1-like esterase